MFITVFVPTFNRASLGEERCTPLRLRHCLIFLHLMLFFLLLFVVSSIISIFMNCAPPPPPLQYSYNFDSSVAVLMMTHLSQATHRSWRTSLTTVQTAPARMSLQMLVPCTVVW